MTRHKHFLFHDSDDFKRLRDAFEAAGYTDAGVLEALEIKDFPSIRGSDVPLLLRRTKRSTPLDTLIRLFLMEVPCQTRTSSSLMSSGRVRKGPRS